MKIDPIAAALKARIAELESDFYQRVTYKQQRNRAMDLLATIPPNYSEHMKSCVCDWCERVAKLLHGYVPEAHSKP